jgi:hypothetical protein
MFGKYHIIIVPNLFQLEGEGRVKEEGEEKGGCPPIPSTALRYEFLLPFGSAEM